MVKADHPLNFAEEFLGIDVGNTMSGDVTKQSRGISASELKAIR